MIVYKLGLVSDALSISSADVVAAIVLSVIFLILAIFIASNLPESSYPENRIDEFLQDHKLLTFILSFAFAALAAFSIFLRLQDNLL